MIIGLISQIFLVGNGWGVDGFAIPRFRRVSSSVARGVLIGGEGCSHRWRRVSSSVADDIFIGGKSTGKGDVSGKKDGGAVRNPGLSSILYGNEEWRIGCAITLQSNSSFIIQNRTERNKLKTTEISDWSPISYREINGSELLLHKEFFGHSIVICQLLVFKHLQNRRLYHDNKTW